MTTSRLRLFKIEKERFFTLGLVFQRDELGLLLPVTLVVQRVVLH